MAQPDLAQFAEKDFDAKAFINAACRGKTGDEPLERCATKGLRVARRVQTAVS